MREKVLQSQKTTVHRPYRSAIPDLCDRRIAAYELSERNDNPLIYKTFDKAIFERFTDSSLELYQVWLLRNHSRYATIVRVVQGFFSAMGRSSIKWENLRGKNRRERCRRDASED